MWTAIISFLGIVGAVVTWWLSPSQIRDRRIKELDEVDKQIKEITERSDDALSKHDSNLVTMYDNLLFELRNRKSILLQRLGKDSP